MPVEREFAALTNVQYYDLSSDILSGSPQEAKDLDKASVENTMRLYELNEPQAKAIIASLKNDGVSLIQGPPGTGIVTPMIQQLDADKLCRQN